MTSNGAFMKECQSQGVLDNDLHAQSVGVGAPETPKEAKMIFVERVDLDENLSLVMGDQSFAVAKSKGPSSLLGTGSSIASASDHSEVSDFESDSGIDNSHNRTTSPEVGVTTSAKNKKRKGVKSSLGVLPPNDLAVTANGAVDDGSGCSYNQSDGVGEQTSCDFRIDSYISCLDNKVDKGMLTKEALELLRLIPDGYIPLPHQVGGHRHVNGRLGFLRRVGQKDILFKPVPRPNGPREILFYKNVFGSHFHDVPKEVMVLKDLVPKYYGTHDIVDRAGETHKFIKLEDIVTRFHKPCIMDVKLGRRVWDDYAEQDKIEREKKKYPLQEVIGFRITGMRVYRNNTDDYLYYDKEYGRRVSVSGTLDALEKFFIEEDDKNRSDVIGPIIERLKYFLHLMEQQKLYRFFATSLLIIYEGDTKRPIRKPKDQLDIRLVDFAHAFEKNPKDFSEPDYNTMFGVKNLIKYLEQLDVGGSGTSGVLSLAC